MLFVLAILLLASSGEAQATARSWPSEPNSFLQERICELNLLGGPRGLPALAEGSLRRAASSRYPYVDKVVRRHFDELFGARSPAPAQSLQYQSSLNRVDFIVRYSSEHGFVTPLFGSNGPVIYDPRATCPPGEECRESGPFSGLGTSAPLPARYVARRMPVAMPDFLRLRYADAPETLASVQESSFRIGIAVNHANLPLLVHYFGAGQDEEALSLRLQAWLWAKGEAESLVPLERFLPSMPARRAHRFPTPELLRGRGAPNCSNAALNFFKADVSACAEANSRQWIDALEAANYEELADPVRESDLRFGDIIHYRGPGGHVARVLFRGEDGVTWVFQKPNYLDLSAFQIVPFKEAFAPYFPPDEPNLLARLQIYRRVR